MTPHIWELYEGRKLRSPKRLGTQVNFQSQSSCIQCTYSVYTVDIEMILLWFVRKFN